MVVIKTLLHDLLKSTYPMPVVVVSKLWFLTRVCIYGISSKEGSYHQMFKHDMYCVSPMGNFTACVSIQHALKSPVRIHLKALLFSQGLYEVLSQSIPLLTVTMLLEM